MTSMTVNVPQHKKKQKSAKFRIWEESIFGDAPISL